MKTKKLKTRIRQAQIADAAFEIVSKEGPRGFTIAKVAKKAGMTPSNVYRHFTNKHAVMGMVLEGMAHSVEKMIRDALGVSASPVKKLEAIFLKHVQIMRERKGIILFMFEDVLSGENQEETTRMRNSLVSLYLNTVQTLLAEAVKKGLLRKDLDIHTASTVFFGNVQMAMLQWLVFGDAFYPDEKRCGKLWHILLHGLLQQQPA